MIRITPGDFSDQRVIDLLHLHVTRARAESPPGSSHALDLTGLQKPEIRFWTLYDGDRLAGCGALKTLTPDHGEIKSMHVVEAIRGKGLGHAMLRHIIETARAAHMTRLSLETGTWPYFQPAKALYERYGFVLCEPFADYRPDPASIFMSLDLTQSAQLDPSPTRV